MDRESTSRLHCYPPQLGGFQSLLILRTILLPSLHSAPSRQLQAHVLPSLKITHTQNHVSFCFLMLFTSSLKSLLRFPVTLSIYRLIGPCISVYSMLAEPCFSCHPCLGCAPPCQLDKFWFLPSHANQRQHFPSGQ